MNRSLKLKTHIVAFDPAYQRVNRFQAINLYPDQFVQPRTFNKFNFAAMRRQVMDPGLIIGMPSTPETDLGL